MSAIKHKAPQNVLTQIERDQNLLAEQPYLLMGFAPELSLRWNALYMKQAGQIAIKHFITYPSEYFPIFRVLTNDLIYGGSKFLLNIARVSNLGSFQPLVLCSTIILAGGILYSSLLTLAAFPIMIGLLLAKIIGRRRRRKMFTINKEFIYMVTISTVALSLVLVYSTIVGEENDRYMIYIFPYLVISALLVLSFLAEKKRPLRWKNLSMSVVTSAVLTVQRNLPRSLNVNLQDSNFSVFGELGQHHRIVRCLSCDLVFSNPRDKRKGLNQKYAELSIEEYLTAKKSRTLTSAKDVRLVQKYCKSGNLLDVGCSTGIFLSQLPKSFNSTGVELSKAACEKAQADLPDASILNGAIDEIEFGNSFFDKWL